MKHEKPLEKAKQEAKPVEAAKALSEAAEAKKEPIQDYIEQLQRLQAEFENFKKREYREKARFVDFAKAEIILKLLNFNDDFQRTLVSLNKADIGVVKTGVEMLALNFQKLLKEEGVEQISCVGVKLDPYKHEVLLQEEADAEDGVILEELQKGYMLKGNVLRHSLVKVCKCVSKQEEQAQKNKTKDENKAETRIEQENNTTEVD